MHGQHSKLIAKIITLYGINFLGFGWRKIVNYKLSIMKINKKDVMFISQEHGTNKKSESLKGFKPINLSTLVFTNLIARWLDHMTGVQRVMCSVPGTQMFFLCPTLVK